jgi:hypothetical protein
MRGRQHLFPLACSLLLFLGCTSSTPVRQNTGTLLNRTDLIPWDEIESLYNSREQRTLQSLKYSGYVVMDGEIAEDGKVRIRKTLESYPDHSRDTLAQVFGNTAVIRTPTLGSLIIPKAGVYVIFYDDNFEGRIALVFAKRLEYSGKGAFAEGVYLNGIRY